MIKVIIYQIIAKSARRAIIFLKKVKIVQIKVKYVVEMAFETM